MLDADPGRTARAACRTEAASRLVREDEPPRDPRRGAARIERDRNRLRHPEQQQVDQRDVHLHGDPLDLGDLVALPRLRRGGVAAARRDSGRSEENTSELQSLMRSSYDGFCLKKKIKTIQ